MSGDGDFRLGCWVVKPRLNTVERNGDSTRLEPKVMAVLCCLADHAGEVVGKEQLIRAVWSDTFVSDDVLTRSISELRRVFADDVRDQKIIQTIPKRGYRLVADVEAAGEAALARRTRFRKYAALTILCFMLALTLAFVLPRNVHRPSLPDFTRLTAGRKISSAVISSDGKYLAYVEEDGKAHSL